MLTPNRGNQPNSSTRSLNVYSNQQPQWTATNGLTANAMDALADRVAVNFTGGEARV